MTAYINQVHALGGKVMLAVEIQAQTGFASIIQALQPLIIANTAGADVVARFDLDPIWYPFNSNALTSQTFQSWPHPTTFGYNWVANDFANAINPTFH